MYVLATEKMIDLDFKEFAVTQFSGNLASIITYDAHETADQRVRNLRTRQVIEGSFEFQCRCFCDELFNRDVG